MSSSAALAMDRGPSRLPITPRSRHDEMLIDKLGELAEDPLGFVMWAYPWTTDRELQVVRLPEPWRTIYDCEWGPDQWACEFLEELGRQIEEREFGGAAAVDPIRFAVASGHGIGKSTMMAWLADFMLCRQPSMGTVTANTGTQLQTRTFPEISKWTKKLICARWFEVVDGTMEVRCIFDRKNWRVVCVTWNEHKSEAFAGQHKAVGTSWYGFDEGSTIPDNILNVSEGGLTDGEPFKFLFGNPTRKTGGFYRAFHVQSDLYTTLQIDSRTCQLANKKLIKEWIDAYGEDSDFVRIRVKGQFPRASATQFIGTDIVARARRAPALSHVTDPVIIGVDVAAQGDCESVIAPRCGMDARTLPWKHLRLSDTMMLVGHVAEYCLDLRRQGIIVAAVVVDAHAIGQGVADRLVQLGWPVTHAYNFPDSNDPKYHNPNDRWWDAMRDWLRTGGAIPDDDTLEEQLVSREYGFDSRSRLSLEKKQHMKDRGVKSPDRADALALTFAAQLAPDVSSLPGAQGNRAETDYDPWRD